MVRINGEMLEEVGKTVKEYLVENNYNLLRVAVEKNGEIVPKSSYENTVFQEGDTVEVVSFVGGG